MVNPSQAVKDPAAAFPDIRLMFLVACVRTNPTKTMGVPDTVNRNTSLPPDLSVGVFSCLKKKKTRIFYLELFQCNWPSGNNLPESNLVLHRRHPRLWSVKSMAFLLEDDVVAYFICYFS